MMMTMATDKTKIRHSEWRRLKSFSLSLGGDEEEKKKMIKKKKKVRDGKEMMEFKKTDCNIDNKKIRKVKLEREIILMVMRKDDDEREDDDDDDGKKAADKREDDDDDNDDELEDNDDCD